MAVSIGTGKEKLLLASEGSTPTGSPTHLISQNNDERNRRHSTINSYTLTNYHTLPRASESLPISRGMSETKALKNIIALGMSFMFVYTAFVSLQTLQSSMNPEGGVGVVSLSCIYATTVFSCLVSPWIINKITTKWTVGIAFILFTAYFAGNFYPKHFMLIPLGAMLGLVTGPLWSAQATYVTTVALAYSKNVHFSDQDVVINKFMGIFCGFYRSSYIWGNLITTLVMSGNSSLHIGPLNGTMTRDVCGSSDCQLSTMDSDTSDVTRLISDIPDSTKYMLLSIYLGCGAMGVVIVLSLLDVGTKASDEESTMSSKALCLSTLKMLTDYRCQLLILLVIFIGLQQGFMFGDFSKSYVNCTLGVHSIGPILICFGAVSAVSSIAIGCFSKHIKRFAFITAGATFNAGLLIVLWLWRPQPTDIPNFYVVAACLGLCDAIWQTQTYTLFGVLFLDRQEAAFASYRMFYATGCAVAFGYSYFLCVETKVYILAVVLAVSLIMYSIIEMKVQFQSQHMKDIVAL